MTDGNNSVKQQKTKRGISLRVLNILLMILTAILALVLLYASTLSFRSLRDARATVENYIYHQRSAYELQIASDYLTEQVRCFVVTGDVSYVDHYFEEANVTKRRDKAIDAIAAELSDTDVYRNLQDAMVSSVELMDLEYYAMRLAVEAYGYDLEDFPEEIRSVELNPVYETMHREAKASAARSMVFGSTYRKQKDAINGSVTKCLDALVDTTGGSMARASNEMQRLLTVERILIIALLVVVVTIVALAFFLVIKPLLRAVDHIREDRPLPENGAYEYRFLARIYNQITKSNRESQEMLAYEATHDQLTDLYNRKGFESLRSSVRSSSAALILFDVDKFKTVNDTYGHETGDRVLIHVAKTVRANFRSSDYICRIGGDEFAVIMTDTNRDYADQIKAKIAHINEIFASPEDDLPKVSISAGVYFCGAPLNSQSAYKAADAALYKVKGSGGRGCEIAE